MKVQDTHTHTSAYTYTEQTPIYTRIFGTYNCEQGVARAATPLQKKIIIIKKSIYLNVQLVYIQRHGIHVQTLTHTYVKATRFRWPRDGKKMRTFASELAEALEVRREME